MRKEGDHESLCWYDDQLSFMPDFDSPRRISQPYTSYNPHYSCKQELELQYNIPHDGFLQLPQLESPKIPQSTTNVSCSLVVPYGFDRSSGSRLQSSTVAQEHLQQSHQQQLNPLFIHNTDQAVDQVTDWRVLDKFVASQLSHEVAAKQSTYSDAPSSIQMVEHMSMLVNDQLKQQEMTSELASMSTPSSQVDLWK